MGCSLVGSHISRVIQEYYKDGILNTTNRYCSRQCTPYDNILSGSGGRQACCKKEGCNMNWETARGDTQEIPNVDYLKPVPMEKSSATTSVLSTKPVTIGIDSVCLVGARMIEDKYFEETGQGGLISYTVLVNKGLVGSQVVN
ncbi:unnamed protein product [Echinostoma caproni]|uniref:Peptidase A1 domain-containing protein n=1 Tax=Echinostoma caproni TaxID=27848 RepID=A0A183B0K7_9TREM|nr:unnamed protein product [Echinostoma caproni]